MAEKQWDDHKYIARVKVKRKTGSNKDTWRYFYDRAEYQAYLKGRNKKSNEKVANVDKLFDSAVKTKLDDGVSVNALEVVDRKLDRNIIYDNAKNEYYITDERSVVDKGKEFMSKVLDGVFGKSIVDDIKDAARDYINDLDIIYEDRKKRPEAFLYDALDRKEKQMTDDEDQAAVNPNYDPYYPGGPYNNNCYACTVAYELRQRGFDVEATADPDGETMGYILDLYVSPMCEIYKYNSETTREKTVKKIKRELCNYPEGSRGQYIVYWSNGGAHSMAWEITNGEVLIRDCQTNKNRTVEELTQLSYETIVFRTDNLDLRPEVLNCVKNRDVKEEGEKYDRY